MRNRVHSATILACIGLCHLALLAAGCGDDDPDHQPTAHSTVIFSPENNNLNAYDVADNFRKQQIIAGDEDGSHGGFAINGQICFDPKGTRRFVCGEDSGQPAVTPGWAMFQLRGRRVGEFSATKITKLVPTYQAAPDNYG